MRALLVTVFALSAFGCHEYVVDPIDPAQPEPTQELPYITLKGPGEVAPGDQPHYRAQFFAGAARYRFQLTTPTGSLVMDSIDPDDQDRDFYARVVYEGEVELRVTAFDANGEAIAASARIIRSRS